MSPHRRFVIYSGLGILIFLVPLPFAERTTILFDVMLTWIRSPVEPVMLPFIVMVVAIIALLTLLGRSPWWVRIGLSARWPMLYASLNVSAPWLVLRCAGAALGLLVWFALGPEALIGADTGVLVFTVVGSAIVFSLLLASLVMPLLTDFGLLELIGTVLEKPFMRVFKLPGRAAIDATTSVLTAASVGLLLTIRQYELGRYSAREAAVVATNFSIVSLPFSLVVAETANLKPWFLPWYLSVLLACVLVATITSRLPPLRGLPESRLAAIDDGDLVSAGSWSLGVTRAVARAGSAPPITDVLQRSIDMGLATICNVVGPSMLIATLTAALVFHTKFFAYLSYPIYLLLQWLSVAQAQVVAPGFVVGLLDQFMPAIVASGVEDARMRFVLAGLSVSQLIYFAEVGLLILRSPLPLGVLQLVGIFVVRTLLLTPLFWLLATFVVG